MTDFKEAVKSLVYFDNVFHDTITEQHNQFYFYNKLHDLKSSASQNRKNFLPLNEANLKLGRFCKQIISKLESETPDSEIVIDLKRKILEWQNYYNSGDTFDTFRYAEYIVGKINSTGFPIWTYSNEACEILNSFIKIPFNTKSFFQINLIIRADELMDFLEKFFTYSNSNYSFHYYIKELTINRSVISLSNEGSDKGYVTIKLILLPGLINSHKNPILDVLISALQKVSNFCSLPITLFDFSEKIDDNLFVSQGSTNYKKFLSLLNIIDKVYQADKNYAYIKNY
ncbi:hypothetical protein SanaruYs_34770 [Chryseotalea sanaruensis]|uniref:Uncharacterized protein n=1 Tax=Chryseotalea sanaruensis TaxID=2482724 RepID=A0A401UEF9_9BACT|nr:hypothetical protein [Chryseotalea sanaruensis]GCC53234.1 hypothetical protein SanaruYs_34770 [Chryseotalea sanaruensis]